MGKGYRPDEGELRFDMFQAEFTHEGDKCTFEVLLDRVVDLVEEGIDAAFRIGHLPESTLIAPPLGETRRVVCAAPAYLKRAGC